MGTGVAMRLPEAAAAEAAEAAEASSLSEAEAAEDTAAEAATSSKTLMSDSPENDKIEFCQFISISRKTADAKARLCLDSRLPGDGKEDFWYNSWQNLLEFLEWATIYCTNRILIGAECHRKDSKRPPPFKTKGVEGRSTAFVRVSGVSWAQSKKMRVDPKGEIRVPKISWKQPSGSLVLFCEFAKRTRTRYNAGSEVITWGWNKRNRKLMHVPS